MAETTPEASTKAATNAVSEPTVDTAVPTSEPAVTDPPVSHPPRTKVGYRSLVVLALVAPIAGAGTGVVDALFRFALEEADAWRNTLLQHARNHAALGFVLVLLGCAAAAALGAFLVRRFSPHAGGSGIPQIEAAA